MRNWINIALPKGRLGEKAYDIFEAIGYGCPSIHEGGRKLIFENEENGVRYFWVKPSDVAGYVTGLCGTRRGGYRCSREGYSSGAVLGCV